MTTGYLAFDAATRAALKRIETVGVDCFGEPLPSPQVQEPVLQALRTRPMRVRQLADRLGMRRFTLQITLETLLARELVRCDDEGFFWGAAA